MFDMFMSNESLVCSELTNLTAAEQKNTVGSQIALNLSNNTQGTFIDCQKDQELKADLSIPGFGISMKEPVMNLVSPATKSKTPVRITKSSLASSLGVVNFNSVTKGPYSMEFTLNVQKKKRALSDSIDTEGWPDSFVYVYQTKETYFIGTQADIQQEIAKKNAENASNNNNGGEFNSELFAILFSILVGFTIIILLAVWWMYFKNKSTAPPRSESPGMMSPTALQLITTQAKPEPEGEMLHKI